MAVALNRLGSWLARSSRWKVRAGALSVAMVLPATGIACSKSCTEEGCGDATSFSVTGVEFTKRDRFTVEGCIDGQCTEAVGITTRDHPIFGDGSAPEVAVVPQGGAEVSVSLNPKGGLEVGEGYDVSLRLKVVGQSLVEVSDRVIMEAYRPNGAGCPGLCATATVDVEV